KERLFQRKPSIAFMYADEPRNLACRGAHGRTVAIRFYTARGGPRYRERSPASSDGRELGNFVFRYAFLCQLSRLVRLRCPEKRIEDAYRSDGDMHGHGRTVYGRWHTDLFQIQYDLDLAVEDHRLP